MPLINLDSLSNKDFWKSAGIEVPSFDIEQVRKETKVNPEWIHFGAGNIFRGFIAELQQRLLEKGITKTGIIAADTFDYEIIDKIYDPFDNLTLLVLMNPDGKLDMKIVASVTEALHADSNNQKAWERLKEIFTTPSLKMASFTITEKGYSLFDMNGNLSNLVKTDIENGPDKPIHAMSIITSLAYTRYCVLDKDGKKGSLPISFVSMDNCSHNGEKLQNAVFEIAKQWKEKGFVDQGFITWLNDKTKVAFPWTMIDKITPRPASSVQEQLTKLNLESIEPITTSKKTFIAPFVNAEKPQYLVIEDDFPAGRPAFEKLNEGTTSSGVYLTDRDTVNKTEKMKVTTCLNPLHTALAVYGCLLGYNSIAAEMKNPLLVKLVKKIGYDEGIPVVVNPGILNPMDFINEVIEQRLPNPYIPDMPQRIATDTSQKIPVRFGETIKSYKTKNLDMNKLTGISLAIAGWFRYLLAIDDNGNKMELSTDPMLQEIQPKLSSIQFGNADSAKGKLKDLLSNKTLFAVNLYETPLAQKIEDFFSFMIQGPGQVQKVLEKNL